MAHQKYRLVTRSDFDGLICAVLLKKLDLIDEIKFVHPKDMQDGLIEITSRDITTNLPYVKGAHLVFDHHLSEQIRFDQNASTVIDFDFNADSYSVGKELANNHIIDPSAPSAARVVYNYYGGINFPPAWREMMAAVDKGDSAQFSRDEILNPTDWVLLNFLTDSRTGLGRFREFTISNYDLMMKLIEWCTSMPIHDIIQLDDVQERVTLYNEHQQSAIEQIKRCSTVYNNVVVLDLRQEPEIFAVNRFMIYALYPQCNISIHVFWSNKQLSTVLAIGKSILNRTSRTNVGELCLSYNGGGHMNAGTCQVDNNHSDEILKAVVDKLNSDG